MSGGLLPVTIPDDIRKGQETQLPALPIEMQERRLGVHRDVPRAGQHTREVLGELGYSPTQISVLIEQGVVGAE